ncbi:putative protein phosphatase methylesterase 1, partial [Fragariocoptes setiger]
MHRSRRDYRPLHWSNYFDRYVDVRTSDTETFRVYVSNLEAAPEIIDNDEYQFNEPSRPTVVFLHGGGYSGLTWALLVKELKNHCDCGLLAIDLRGHGCTQTSDESNLSMDTMVDDVERVITCFHEQLGYNSEDCLRPMPNIVLVGHSMGGAVAVKCAANVSETYLPSLLGFVVIDVVEGTAIDALQGMQSVLRARPRHFTSLENAIEWSVRSGMTRNNEAARVSMPDLMKTQTHWNGWFKGLSNDLLNAPVRAKLLLLAGIDRLDKDLTIGQMQGKFMMRVLPKCGHAVHEDVPEQVSEVIAKFLVRNKIVEKR